MATKVTWTFTKTYTEEEMKALGFSEHNELQRHGYTEIALDCLLADSCDDFNLDMTYEEV